MVASKKKEVFRILDLVGEQQADCLQGLLAPVDVVAEEEVVGVRREATVLKETEEVCVLSVDVSCEGGREGV